MDTALPASSTPVPGNPEIRRIDAADLRWALAEGWRDFRARRGDLLFVGLLYPIIGLVVSGLALDRRLFPLVFPLIAGLSILGPAVSAGFYELARRRESGLESGWRHFFDPVRGRSRVPLATLTVFLAALFLAWLAAAWAVYEVTLGRNPPADVGAFLSQLFTTGDGWSMIVLGNLVGLAFAVVTLALSAISFPMVVDQPVDAGAAVATSLRAFSANRTVLLGWGVRVALILLVAAIPLFVGLAVALPVLGYATWHLYTRVVVR